MQVKKTCQFQLVKTKNFKDEETCLKHYIIRDRTKHLLSQLHMRFLGSNCKNMEVAIHDSDRFLEIKYHRRSIRPQLIASDLKAAILSDTYPQPWKI